MSVFPNGTRVDAAMWRLPLKRCRGTVVDSDPLRADSGGLTYLVEFDDTPGAENECYPSLTGETDRRWWCTKIAVTRISLLDLIAEAAQ